MPDETKIPLDAQDIIRKLLVVEPSKRLGSGADDSDLSMDALKAHRFFEGINFNGLHLQKAPIAPKTVKCTSSTNNLKLTQSTEE